MIYTYSREKLDGREAWNCPHPERVTHLHEDINLNVSGLKSVRMHDNYIECTFYGELLPYQIEALENTINNHKLNL